MTWFHMFCKLMSIYILFAFLLLLIIHILDTFRQLMLTNKLHTLAHKVCFVKIFVVKYCK